MGVDERLSLDAVSADTLIAAEHLHRYQLAAELCAGLRVVDLACGSGYGSAILRRTATAVHGVDNDAATIDAARATVGRESDVTFEAADAIEFLTRGLDADWDALVCFEGIEHFRDPAPAVAALRELADRGTRLVISLPNSRTFAEENEFHLTDFAFDEVMKLYAQLGDAHMLFQFNAEGSLIRSEQAGPLEAEGVLSDHGEPDYANHFIVCVNVDPAATDAVQSARMRLAVAPAYNRHMLALERANRELWRENARLARGHLGKSDAAAATTLFRLQRELRARAEEAETRNLALEAEVAELRRLVETPRHVAVERARDSVMRSRPAYAIIRRAWRLVNRR
jgi:2-polyprenyl-3-methyl-5-hydroxy-6-metoxy-1,4-benzoquinol methylase